MKNLSLISFVVIGLLSGASRGYAAIESMSLPAVFKSYDENSAKIEVQNRQILVPRASISTAGISDGEPVIVTLKGKAVANFLKDLSSK